MSGQKNVSSPSSSSVKCKKRQRNQVFFIARSGNLCCGPFFLKLRPKIIRQLRQEDLFWPDVKLYPINSAQFVYGYMESLTINSRRSIGKSVDLIKAASKIWKVVQLSRLRNINLYHADLWHGETSTEVCTCLNSSNTLQLISQQRMVIEWCFVFLNALPRTNESICGIRMDLFWINGIFFKFGRATVKLNAFGPECSCTRPKYSLTVDSLGSSVETVNSKWIFWSCTRTFKYYCLIPT